MQRGTSVLESTWLLQRGHRWAAQILTLPPHDDAFALVQPLLHPMESFDNWKYPQGKGTFDSTTWGNPSTHYETTWTCVMSAESLVLVCIDLCRQIRAKKGVGIWQAPSPPNWPPLGSILPTSTPLWPCRSKGLKARRRGCFKQAFRYLKNWVLFLWEPHWHKGKYLQCFEFAMASTAIIFISNPQNVFCGSTRLHQPLLHHLGPWIGLDEFLQTIALSVAGHAVSENQLLVNIIKYTAQS